MDNNTYRIDTEALTVLATDRATGESYDLNASGELCFNRDDLAYFICELCEQGAYDEDVRDALLDEVR